MRDYLMYLLARLAVLMGTIVVVWWIAGAGLISVSYTHLTLPTNREV